MEASFSIDDNPVSLIDSTFLSILSFAKYIISTSKTLDNSTIRAQGILQLPASKFEYAF